MDAAIVTAVISFGLGTVLGTYLKIRWERSNSAQVQKQEYKTTRYKAVLILMYDSLDFDKAKDKLKKHGRDYNTLGDLIDELKIEWDNMLLYASSEVLKTFQAFIILPDKNNFRRCALAMRKDLWGGKVTLRIEDISI
jgi:hypothetical protein